jgi:Icc-related predicted phosphoesterase
VAAFGDLHYSKTSPGSLQALFAQIAERADLVIICGDLTDYGLPEEARLLARELTSTIKAPITAVLGNHDYEAGKAAEIAEIMRDAGVSMLDGDSIEILGIGIAGVKGFAGGFGRHALGPWGEESIKRFVREAVDEALKLETALARLRTPTRLAVLHYAPVQSTVEGEPPVIYPFLGCSRLEEPLNRYPVHAVLHGHAHNGRPIGRTASDVPVYNTSLPLLRRLTPEQPFVLLEIAVGHEPTPVQTTGQPATRFP